MKKTIVLAASSLLFYCLLRDMTLIRILILCAAMACAYLVSRVPSKYVQGAKYPVIGLCLALCPALVAYPALRPHFATAPGAMILAFYSIALFLVTMEEKGKQVYKEVIGFCLLYAASFTNLFLTGRADLMLPLSICVLLFLFIINKVRIMPFAAGLGVAAMVILVLTGDHLLGPAPWPNTVERYVLLAAAFALLLAGFIGFVKRPDFVAVLSFFGLLYVSIDLLISMGFKLKGILLQQPVIALFLVGPIVGMAMKGEKERP